MKNVRGASIVSNQRSDGSTELFSESDHFVIGGEDLLAASHVSAGQEGIPPDKRDQVQRDITADIRVRIGTLLKAESVSFLLGAGASVESGGLTIGSFPLAVERTLHEVGLSNAGGSSVPPWLRILYLATRAAGGGSSSPTTDETILERRDQVACGGSSVSPIRSNFEQVLSTLHRWRAALYGNAVCLHINGAPQDAVTSNELDKCLVKATQALAQHCVLPTAANQDGYASHKKFIRKLLTRPLNLKRVSLFSLNYDTLVEQAADAEGIVLLDGFVGTRRRIFRPESYEQDLYFPAETTEGRVHRFDRVLHLYKLHGSVTWVADTPSLDNPYGIAARNSEEAEVETDHRLLIYPTPAKASDTLGMPYAEMFRRFATKVVCPQSVLFVVGYGFGDEHVNAIIRQALAIPSFTLVIVDPAPLSQFVENLRDQNDRRVWIVEGRTFGTFSGFVRKALPDLRDEEINKKVLATHRALVEGNCSTGGIPNVC